MKECSINIDDVTTYIEGYGTETVLNALKDKYGSLSKAEEIEKRLKNPNPGHDKIGKYYGLIKGDYVTRGVWNEKLKGETIKPGEIFNKDGKFSAECVEYGKDEDGNPLFRVKVIKNDFLCPEGKTTPYIAVAKIWDTEIDTSGFNPNEYRKKGKIFDNNVVVARSSVCKEKQCISRDERWSKKNLQKAKIF